MRLLVEANPVPDLASLDAAEVNATRYLATLDKRSSNMKSEDRTERPGRGRRRPLAAMALAAVTVGVLGTVTWLTSGANETGTAVEVAHAWVAARNAGDIEMVLGLTADDATLLGHSMDLPHRRDDFVELLRAQAAASFAISETDCVVDDELVSCRYQLSDVFLRGLGVALTGDHQYVVRDGLIISAERTHDPEARSNVANAMREFRSWVKEHYPELEAVIWTSRGSTSYSTVDGVQAMQSIFEEYLAFR
jgi:hypothetical protein